MLLNSFSSYSSGNNGGLESAFGGSTVDELCDALKSKSLTLGESYIDIGAYDKPKTYREVINVSGRGTILKLGCSYGIDSYSGHVKGDYIIFAIRITVDGDIILNAAHKYIDGGDSGQIFKAGYGLCARSISNLPYVYKESDIISGDDEYTDNTILVRNPAYKITTTDGSGNTAEARRTGVQKYVDVPITFNELKVELGIVVNSNLYNDDQSTKSGSFKMDYLLF